MRLEKVIALSVVFACSACADDDFDDDNNDVAATTDGAYALEGTDAANWDTASAYAATDSLADPFFLADRIGEGDAPSPSNDPEMAAAAAADAAGNYFSPASCVTATADGSEAMYVLSSCTGPLGLHKASGTIHVTFSKPAPDDEDAAVQSEGDAGALNAVLAIDVISHDLQIDNATAMLDLHGTYSRSETGDKQLVMHSKGMHTRNGQSVLRDVMVTAHWKAGTQCIDVDANGTLVTGSTTLDITIDDFQRCKDDCPKAGTVRIVGDRTVTLTLDGTDQPDFASSNGRTGSINLDCQ